MTSVRIEGSDIDIEVEPNETLTEAAWRQGYSWPTKCYGQLECMQCFVRVKEGDINIVPAEEQETFAMRTRFPPRLRSRMVRLACRVKVSGPGVVLEKKGVKAPAPAVAAGGGIENESKDELK
ncbi:2Fe-2S iron-sulfur cluster-binding protein [Rhodococcus qingshengii]|uniref:2Fe-2S iron-sulfur cluster-binding protein n=1 Tax=Rhodococcus qingshengii TaxID=334542 RepID=UPI001BE5D26C|nr:2Fe-2S iron-sulfur cluster-binding protein [Rhodococcus qingshengii]MBT2276318.1 2Fe-2S iron-sulfur cluster binding domain-containing protein [Rhodococcus qingshengii]